MAEPSESGKAAAEADPEEAGSRPWTEVLPADEPAERVSSDDSPTGERSTRALPWALLAALTAIAIALFWSACEAHYQACVQAVETRSGSDTGALARLAREEGVDQCNRAPF